jgi:hypothetical protein
MEPGTRFKVKALARSGKFSASHISATLHTAFDGKMCNKLNTQLREKI